MIIDKMGVKCNQIVMLYHHVKAQFSLFLMIEKGFLKRFCIFQLLELLLDTRPQLLDT